MRMPPVQSSRRAILAGVLLATGLFFLVYLALPLPDVRPWVQRWTPVGANVAAMITAVIAISAGLVGFRKFLGADVFRPNVWIELDAHVIAQDDDTFVSVTLLLENKGVRTIVVRGDLSRTRDSITSYVGAVSIAAEDWSSSGRIEWDSDSEEGFLLDEQSTTPHAVKQKLTPGEKIDFPFLIPVPRNTIAARVHARVYVEDKRGREGNYYHAYKIVARTKD